MGNNEDLVKELEDNILLINNILADKFVTRIKPSVERLQQILLYYQEIFDIWTECQRDWMYLEPIFNSGDMMKDLVKETKLFLKEIHQPLLKFVKEVTDDQFKLKRKIRDKDQRL